MLVSVSRVVTLVVVLAAGGCSAESSEAGAVAAGGGGGGAAGGNAGSSSAAASTAGAGAGGAAGSSGANAGSSAGAVAGMAGAGGALGGAGAGGAASLPRPSLPNAVLWLEAAETTSIGLEAEHVAKWQDLSGSHNDAVQGSAGVRPTLLTAPTARVHFEAARHTYLGVADAESLRWGTGDFTVALVFAHTNQPFAEGAPGQHLGGWAFALNKITQPSGPRIGWGIMGNWPNGEDAPVRTAVGCETTEAGGVILTKENGYNDGVLRLWVMHRDTARGVVELRQNGVVSGSAKGGPFLDGVDAPGTGITLGGARLNPNNQNSAGFNLGGDIAAVVGVKGALADAELRALEQYLMKRYQIGGSLDIDSTGAP